MLTMASIVIQRNARGRDSHAAVQGVQGEAELDERPEYLKKFPPASDMLKDYKLAVLLGRSGKFTRHLWFEPAQNI